MTEEPVDPRVEGDQLIIETRNETEVYDSRFLVAAALVWVAKGDGRISESETEKMLELVSGHFGLRSSESLEVLTRAIAQIAQNPDVGSILRELGTLITSREKEDVVVMMLKVIAADGRRDAEEMESLSQAAEVLDVSQESMHRAFDRYFEEKDG